MATKRFHSNEGEVNRAPPNYDADAIQNWLTHLAEAENDNIAMLRRNQRTFRNICYEDIVRDRNGTMKMFAETLGVEMNVDEFTGPVEGELRKIGDAWNDEAEQRFRAERGDFLGRIESARQAKKIVAPEGMG